MDMREVFTIDGRRFSNMAGFYDEVEQVFICGLDWKIGRNLNAFNDILRGGFGRHEYGQPIHIQWLAYEKSVRMELMPMAQAPALGEVVSNTSAKERQHKCEVLISEAMGIASVQNPFTDRNMPYEQPFQPDAGDAEAVPIFVILSPIC